MPTEEQKDNSVEFKIEFRDVVHFYKVITWLNKNVGHGAKRWTMDGRVLKYLKDGQPKLVNLRVFDKEFEEENALFLCLI